MGVRSDMGKGSPLYKPSLGKSAMVWGPQSYDLPLLPFEKQLIETIGATEEEYRKLVAHAMWSGRKRPAGYEHIPDIRCDPIFTPAAAGAAGIFGTGYVLTTFGAIVLAAVSYAVSYLLAPKPKQIGSPRNERLASVNTTGRFSPTFGFESQAELANYRDPIPLIFANAYYHGNTYKSGGVLVSPRLVWSQMMSLGKQQAVKLLMIVGEQGGNYKSPGSANAGIAPPDLSGVFIGNGAIDTVYRDLFSFYWKKNTVGNNPRIRESDQKYGNAQADIDFDPINNNEIFLCSTRHQEDDRGFCSAHSLTNNTDFGCYAPIRNGSPYRLTWRTVSIPHISDGIDDDPSPYVQGYERWKIAGDKLGNYRQNQTSNANRELSTYATSAQNFGMEVSKNKTQDLGMPGIARNYSCRMGIIDYYEKYNANGVSITEVLHQSTTNGLVKSGSNNWIPMREFSDVQRGDRCLFIIKPGTQKIRSDLYAEGKVKVEDIDNAIDELRQAADDALQTGEIFAIGGTIWRVLSRSIPIWTPETTTDQRIILECINNGGDGYNKIGVVAPALLDPTVDKIKEVRNMDGSERPEWSNFGPGVGTDGDDHEGYGPIDGDGFIGDSPQFGALPASTWYPLMHVAHSIIRNKRICDRTEIGIRSVVYQRINNACNYNSLMTVPELAKAETDTGDSKRGISVQSGTMNKYIARASVFTIKVREVDGPWYAEEMKKSKPYPDLAGWKKFNVKFVVVGSRNTPQFNSIKIEHPQNGNPKSYEFQICPLNAAAIRTYDGEFIRLFSGHGGVNDNIINRRANIYQIAGNDFSFQCKGIVVTKAAIKSNKEFTNSTSSNTTTLAVEKQMAVKIKDHLPTNTAVPNISLLSEVKYVRNLAERSDGNTGGVGQFGAWSWEIFGPADANSPNTRVVELDKYTDDAILESTTNKPLSFRFKLIKVALSDNHWSGQTHVWWVEIDGDDPKFGNENGYLPKHMNQDDHNTDWATNQDIDIKKTLRTNNPWRTAGPGADLVKAGVKLRVKGVTHVTRDRGVQYGVAWQIFGVPTNVGDTKEVDIVMKKKESMPTDQETNLTGNKQVKLRLRSTVIHLDAHWSGQTKAWDIPSVEALVNDDQTTGTWNKGFEFDYTILPPNSGTLNPFRTRQVSGTDSWIGYRFRVIDYDVSEIVVGTTLDPDEQSRIWVHNSQYADLHLYATDVSKSNESQAEHTIAYVNESLENKNNNGERFVPIYDKTTTAGLLLKATRDFTNLDQVRVWLKTGIPVKRLHPDRESTYGDDKEFGPSNLLTDVFYHLLVDRVGGVGQTLGPTDNSISLIDLDDDTGLPHTAKFLYRNRIFFDGAISSQENIREYMAETAMYSLCGLVLTNGRFSLKPVIPTRSNGTIKDNSAVEISQIFTDGNILEGSFEVSYLSLDERKPFKASVRYRKEMKNQFPEERTVLVQWKGGDGDSQGSVGFSSDDIPTESFDLTQFCTRKDHAELVGKYFISIRRMVTHTISFKTTPYGLNLKPFDLIKVSTTVSPYSSTNNGTVDATGNITALKNLENREYDVVYYPTGSAEEVKESTMTVTGAPDSPSASQSRFYNSVFSINKPTNSMDVYRVEQLTMEEDGTVAIIASEFPCNGNEVSHVAHQIHPNQGDFWDIDSLQSD